MLRQRRVQNKEPWERVWRKTGNSLGRLSLDRDAPLAALACLRLTLDFLLVATTTPVQTLL